MKTAIHNGLEIFNRALKADKLRKAMQRELYLEAAKRVARGERVEIS